MKSEDSIAEMSRHIDESWTIFLDRDGVINRRLVGDYVKNITAFEFLPGAKEAIKYFSDRFNRVIIVTNQQGVAKGIMEAADVEIVHDFLRKQITEIGGHIDAIYYCPDWADKPFNCRKPSPKMGLLAKNDFPEIDFEKSIMVGDMPSDIQFGHDLGMFTVWIPGEGVTHFDGIMPPDFLAKSLEDLQIALEK